MESVNRIINSVDKVLAGIYANKVSSSVLTLFLVLYAGLAAPKLPMRIANLFSNRMFRMFYIFMIAYMSSRNTSIALIASVGLVISLQTLSSHNMKSLAIKNTVEELTSDENQPTEELQHPFTEEETNLQAPHPMVEGNINSMPEEATHHMVEEIVQHMPEESVKNMQEENAQHAPEEIVSNIPEEAKIVKKAKASLSKASQHMEENNVEKAKKSLNKATVHIVVAENKMEEENKPNKDLSKAKESAQKAEQKMEENNMEEAKTHIETATKHVQQAEQNDMGVSVLCE